MIKQANQLVEYCLQRQAVLAPLSFQIKNGDRVALAQTSFSPLQVLIDIPFELVISLQEAQKSLQGISFHGLRTPSHSKLSVHLWKLDKAGHPYAGHLTRNLSSFPLFYSSKDLLLLEGTALQQLLLEKVDDLLFDHKILTQQGIPISFDDFCWARTMVSSRAFRSLGPSGQSKAMYPLVDLLNHSFKPNCELLVCEQERRVQVRSLCQIKEKEELNLNYGDKPNSKLLLNYGFTVINNPFDEVILKLLVKDFPAQKVELITSKLLVFRFKTTACLGFQALLQFCHYLSSQQVGAKSDQNHNLLLPEPQSTKGGKLLKELLKKQIERGVSLQQGVQRVGSGETNERNVGVYQMGERLVLLGTEKWLDEQQYQ